MVTGADRPTTNARRTLISSQNEILAPRSAASDSEDRGGAVRVNAGVQFPTTPATYEAACGTSSCFLDWR
jgi:hypothetical protein